MKQRYDYRVLGRNFRVTNDTFVTGLNNNDIIIGGSGSGKSGGILYPSLKCTENESFILIDPKGQMANRLKEDFIRKGYDVKIISFTKPEESFGYNPLDFIRINEDGTIRYQDIVYISRVMMPTLDKSEPIWEESGRLIIQFLIAFCIEKLDKADWNMKSIISLYHILLKDEGISYFMDSLADDMDSFAAKKLLEISVNKAAEKMYASVVGFVNVALEPFGYAEIQEVLCNEESIDFHEIGRRKQAVFVQVSDVDRTYDTIVNLFMSQALKILIEDADDSMEGRLNIPVRLYFDDFGAICPVPDFEKTISVIRSRDIYVTLIMQSTTQLYSMYNEHEAKTILANCDHIIYLSSTDISSVEYIADRAQRTKESIMLMDRRKEYVIVSGEKALLIDKNTPYAEICLE